MLSHPVQSRINLKYCVVVHGSYIKNMKPLFDEVRWPAVALRPWSAYVYLSGWEPHEFNSNGGYGIFGTGGEEEGMSQTMRCEDWQVGWAAWHKRSSSRVHKA